MSKEKRDQSWAEMTKTQELIHGQTILVEGLRSDFKLVTEKVQGMETSLRKEMKENKRELGQKMSDMQGALILRMDTIRAELKQEIKGVENRLEHRIVNVENGVAGVEDRLIGVEERLTAKIDQIGGKVEKHDHEIKEIKSSVASH